MPTPLMQPGEPVEFFTANPIGVPPINSAVFALPGIKSKMITWGSRFSVAPASVSLKLQVSMDDVVYVDLDTSTNVAGEMKTAGPTAAKFIRVRKEAQTGAGDLTVTVQMAYQG